MRRLGRTLLGAIQSALTPMVVLTSIPGTFGSIVLAMQGEVLGSFMLMAGFMLLFLPWLAIEKFLAPPKLPPPRRELVGSRGRSLGSVFKAIKEQDNQWRKPLY